MSANNVQCARLGKELPGLERAPVPGALGQQILERVSAEAWQLWQAEEVLTINHYGLNLVNAEHLEFLFARMKAYLLEGAPGVDTSKPPEDGPNTKPFS